MGDAFRKRKGHDLLAIEALGCPCVQDPEEALLVFAHGGDIARLYAIGEVKELEVVVAELGMGEL